MIKANFNTYNNYVTDSLYQWDLNQDLVINGLNLTVAPEIHFANADMDRAIVRQSTLESGVVTVRIPNSLLQAPLTIKAYVGVYEGETFKVIETIEIPIIAKTKPADYTIEDSDEEIYSFKALSNQIGNIVANANSTEGNSELVDIRQDYKGVIHTSAGSAVRSQFGELNENKIDKSSVVQTTGDNTDYVMSQQAVSREIENITDAINTEKNRAISRENKLEELFTLPTQEAVNKWLDENPEATTTVQDGALTDAKFSEILKHQTIKDYVTPEMFGAVGDGETDDTDAFEQMLTEHTSILIPNKRYKITRKLYPQPKTYISGCGKNSVIVCHSTEDLFMVSGYTYITNFSVDIQSRLSGAVFKINEESLANFKAPDGALGTKIDKIWISVGEVESVDPQLACFEISNSGYDSGFFDVTISNIAAYAHPSRNLGYFFKSFVKGKDYWITGIHVTDCKIYGARWGFFLSENDNNMFDPAVTSSSSELVITRVQHQKTSTNCRAFIFKRATGKVRSIDSNPWDWAEYGEADTRYAYLIEKKAFDIALPSSQGLYVNTSNPNIIKLFAGIDDLGNLFPLGYNDYHKLCNIGTDIPLDELRPKIIGINGIGDTKPAAMLIYKAEELSRKYTIHFDLFANGNTCYVQILHSLDGTVKAILDKDWCHGLSLAYKKADGMFYVYLVFSPSASRIYDGFLRSREFANSIVSYSKDNTYTTYNHTINCWDLSENEIYLTEAPADVTKILKSNIVVNSFAPVLTSPNGSLYNIMVDDYGNITSGGLGNLNVPTIVSPNGSRYKLVVDNNGNLTTQKVEDTLNKYSQSWADEY